MKASEEKIHVDIVWLVTYLAAYYNWKRKSAMQVIKQKDLIITKNSFN